MTMEAINSVLVKIGEVAENEAADKVYHAIQSGDTADVTGEDIAETLSLLEGEVVFQVINPNGERGHVFSDDGELRCIAEDRAFIKELNVDAEQIDGVQDRLPAEFIPFDHSLAVGEMDVR